MDIIPSEGKGILKKKLTCPWQMRMEGRRLWEVVAMQNTLLRIYTSCENYTAYHMEKGIKIVQPKNQQNKEEESYDFGAQSGNRMATFHGSLCRHFPNTSVAEKKSNFKNLLPLQ